VFSENRNETAVVLRRDADPRYLVTGPYQGDADMQVFHVLTKFAEGRPQWLRMAGYREPQSVPDALLPKAGRRLVQAFRVEDGPSSIAVDQFMVVAGETPPVFLLPKGHYRFTYQE